MAGIPRGKIDWPHFLARTSIHDLVVAACGIVMAATGIPALYEAQHPKLAFIAIIATAISLLLVAIRIIAVFLYEKERESSHELEGCLETIRAILLVDAIQDFPNVLLRMTIHRLEGEGDKQQLYQVMDYVGDGRGGVTRGRRFSNKSGVIGEAVRKKEISEGDRQNDDYESYIQELVSDWNYTDEEARKLNSATKAWLAIPLMTTEPTGEKKVQGVFYCDSTVRGIFNADRKAIAVAACTGIVRFLVKK